MMKNRKGLLAGLFMLGLSVAGMMGSTVAAEEYYGEYYGEYYDDYYDDGYYEEEYVLDGNDSLYELGLDKEYKCSPDFVYNVLEYNVTVPAGTKKVELDPVKSSSTAEIAEIKGTTLDDKGKATVEITVVAENGASSTYILHVTSEKAAKANTTKKKKKKAAVTETEKETEKETESKEEKVKETEANVKMDKLALEAVESEKLLLESEKEALNQRIAQLEQKEGKVALLQGENDDLAYRLDLLMKVLYGLIAFSVLLLFFIINQSLRNKDLKDDIKKTKAELEVEKAKGPVNNLYYTSAADAPVFTPAENVPLSKKEQKRLAKEAKKNAKIESKQAKAPAKEAEAPVFVPAEEPKQPEAAPAEAEAPAEPQPVSNEPQLVKGSVNEPDVKVNMIDL